MSDIQVVNYIQIIEISTEAKYKVRIEITKVDNCFFVALLSLIIDGEFKGLYLEFSKPLFKFADYKTAFEYAIKAFVLLLQYSNKGFIKEINNPCGCEYISVNEQKDVLQSLGLQVNVTEESR